MEVWSGRWRTVRGGTFCASRYLSSLWYSQARASAARRSSLLGGRRRRTADKRRVHNLHLGLAIYAAKPLVGVDVLQFVIDLVAHLGKRPHRDFFGAQQVESVRLLERFGDFALLEREHRRAKGVGDIVAAPQRGEIAILLP